MVVEAQAAEQEQTEDRAGLVVVVVAVYAVEAADLAVAVVEVPQHLEGLAVMEAAEEEIVVLLVLAVPVPCFYSGRRATNASPRMDRAQRRS